MAGFFGLFGSKTKYIDEVEMTEAQSTNDSGAFFLDPDESKTLGNIEFMKKTQTIKKTFPKTRNSEGGEIVQEISAMEKKQVSNNGTSPAASTSTPDLSPVANQESRSPDANLDMFRQMARNMKKK